MKKYKIVTRENIHPPHQHQYQLRWYTCFGLAWKVEEVPNTLDPEEMKYPAYCADVHEWVDSKEYIYKYLELKEEYEKWREGLPKPPEWKIVKKENL